MAEEDLELVDSSYSVLDADGLRILANYLDMLELRKPEYEGAQPLDGTLLTPSVIESDGWAMVAFRYADDIDDKPRVCLFASNDDSPEF